MLALHYVAALHYVVALHYMVALHYTVALDYVFNYMKNVSLLFLLRLLHRCCSLLRLPGTASPRSLATHDGTHAALNVATSEIKHG